MKAFGFFLCYWETLASRLMAAVHQSRLQVVCEISETNGELNNEYKEQRQLAAVSPTFLSIKIKIKTKHPFFSLSI